MPSPATLTARLVPRLFYGWWVVVAGYIVGTLGGGIYFYGFTVFFLPVSQDLGLSYALTALVMSQARVEGAFLGPLAGWLIDRWGARAMLIIGIALSGVGYLLLATAQSFVSFLVIYLGLVSLGFNLGFFSALMAAVNHWFVRRRGMAMSVLMSSLGAGGAFIVPLLSAVVLGWGWRTGAVLSGIALLVVALPASLPVRRSPESMGLQPDGLPAPAAGEDNRTAEPEISARRALRTRAFWLLSAALTLRVAVFGTLVVHLVPIFVWQGLDAQMAANMVGLLALLSIPTRIGMGWVGDRFGKARVISGALLLGAFSLLALVLGTQVWHFVLFTVIFAVSDGASPLAWALVGDLFGRRSFATVRGTMNLFYPWGMVVLPVVVGWGFDRTQSYQVALWGFVILFALAAVLFSVVRPPARAKGDGSQKR